MPKIIKKQKKKSGLETPAEKTEEIKKTKIRVIGIGGGGGNIVSEIASKVSKASFVVANTDSKSLKSCNRKVIKFQFGQNFTHGLGTGMNPELGREAALSEKERIKKLCQGQDLCILVASLGGGTGSGAVSTFAKISKNLGNLTYGIFTLPFKFEGEKKMEIAINSLKEARGHFNAMTIIPNERVFQTINKETPLKEALSTINKFLSESLEGLIETIYEPGLINIDFADFKTILEGRGRIAYLNTQVQRRVEKRTKSSSTTVEERRKEGAIKDMTAKVLNSPLYPYTIRGAKGVLFNIAGEKNLSLDDVNQISKAISELVNPEAKIIFGISQHKKYANIVKTTLLATGCGGGGIKISSSEKKKVNPSTALRPFEALRSPQALEEVNAEQSRSIKKRKKKKEEKNEKPKDKTKEQEKASPKKVKIKAIKKAKEEKHQESENKEKETIVSSNNEERVRKNALQIKKEAEELEKEMIEKEKFWETPAFLRKK